jgi:hypothetical protein
MAERHSSSAKAKKGIKSEGVSEPLLGTQPNTNHFHGGKLKERQCYDSNL